MLALIRSSQLRRGRTVHLKLSSSTATQLPSYIVVPSWFENRTVYQSVSTARSWLFLAVRAGEHNFPTHHHQEIQIEGEWTRQSPRETDRVKWWGCHAVQGWRALLILRPVVAQRQRWRTGQRQWSRICGSRVGWKWRRRHWQHRTSSEQPPRPSVACEFFVLIVPWKEWLIVS